MKLLELLEDHTIWAPGLGAESLVLDFGAHKGRFSRHMRERFGCRCHAIEANPALIKKIGSAPGLQVHHLALAAQSGPIRFHLSANPEASTILDQAPAEESTIEVSAVRLEEFLAQIGNPQVDVLKLDIEGAEIQVLESAPAEVLRSFGQITVEFHETFGITPLEDVLRVVRRLEELGFYPIRTKRDGWGDTLFVNRSLSSATPLRLAWARHVVRNAWGLRRVAVRLLRLGNRQ